MSAGSWDYIYLKLENLANNLKLENCNHRKLLGGVVTELAYTMKIIEWVDSADMPPSDDVKAIKKFFRKLRLGVIFDYAIKLIEEESKK